MSGARACLFDLGGVLKRTATVHAAVWKEMFDGYLGVRTGEEGFAPFDPAVDDAEYVDGKPRYDGVRSFAGALRENGADVVVSDLSELLEGR